MVITDTKGIWAGLELFNLEGDHGHGSLTASLGNQLTRVQSSGFTTLGLIKQQLSEPADGWVRITSCWSKLECLRSLREVALVFEVAGQKAKYLQQRNKKICVEKVKVCLYGVHDPTEVKST